jgi:hypothetical protein
MTLRTKGECRMGVIISEEEWPSFTGAIRDAMARYVYPYTTPIAYAPPGTTEARSHGTGNYVSLDGATYLLTNEHVAAKGTEGLAHLPGPTDDYIALLGAWQCATFPVDAGWLRLHSAGSVAARPCVEASMFDERCHPVEHELLFWLGYPGSRAQRHEPVTESNTRYNWFDGPLETPAVPMLTVASQETPDWLGIFDPEVHVAVHYPGTAWRSEEHPQAVLPNPKGMSGSLLWDTKAIASIRQGKAWSPEMARVCGLVALDFEKQELVVATRVEYVRFAIRHFILDERAYAHWEARGRPLWDAETDWYSAESTSLEI